MKGEWRFVASLKQITKKNSYTDELAAGESRRMALCYLAPHPRRTGGNIMLALSFLGTTSLRGLWELRGTV